MTSRNAVAAALIAGNSILSGSPVEAQPTPASRLAETLGLPLGRTSSHFNRATNTAVTEQCKITSPDSVECSLRIMGNGAQIDAKQVHGYSLAGGGLKVTARDAGHALWSQDMFDNDFKPARKAGEGSLITLSQKSPLFAEEQNSVRRLETSPGAVSVSSIIPVNDQRALRLSMKFDDATGAVSLSAATTVSYNGVTISAGTAASRSYNKYDGEHFDRFTAEAARGPLAGRSP